MKTPVPYPGIEPMGRGTHQVESLTGYWHRLSNEFVLPPGLTFDKHLFEEIHRIMPWGKAADTRAETLHKLNGAGQVVEVGLDKISELTGRADLRSTTLLGLNELGGFPTGSHLVSDIKKWCRLCWEEDETGRYERLLWWLPVVDVCPVHSVKLTNRCLKCGRRQPDLVRDVRVGVCGLCGHDLEGAKRPIPEDEESEAGRRLWYARRAAELIGLVQGLEANGQGGDELAEVRRVGLKKLHEKLEEIDDPSEVSKDVGRWIERGRMGSLEELFSALWLSRCSVPEIFQA